MGNKEIFDRMADNYDTPDRIDLANISAERIKKYLRDTKGKTAIDFGCGTGLVGLALAENFKSILLIDSSENMIDFVSRKIENENIRNAKALCVDLETESCDIKPVDYIILVNVLLHIKDTDDILKKLTSLINTGGHLVIVDFDKNYSVSSDMVHNGFIRDELANTLAQIGYQDVSHEIFYEGKNIFMNEDASMFIMHGNKNQSS